MERGIRKRAFAAIAFGLVWPGLVALVASAGCVDIDGGAVEIAWALFTKDGRAITDCACADPAIPYVRLNLVSDPVSGSDSCLALNPAGDSEPCAGRGACRFSCDRKMGATPFMIPPGRYLMSLVAVGADGVDLAEGAVETPAPQSRCVVRGQPTQLEAYMLRTNCATQCNSADFTQPCADE